MVIPTKQSQIEPLSEQEEAEKKAQLNESEQETLLRIQQAAAIYGVPAWEREEVRERVYSQYLRSYNNLPPKDKRGSQPYSFEKFLEDFRFDWFSLCVRCKLCGTMNGWGGHHGIPCGKYNKPRPREFGWLGGCDLYEPIEPEFEQLELFGSEEDRGGNSSE